MQTSHAHTADPRPSGDDALWSSFVQATSVEQLHRTWLAVLCGLVPGTRTGLLLLEDDDHSFAPAAIWPLAEPPGHLADIAHQVLTQREGVVQPGAQGLYRFAYPLLSQGHLLGAIVLEVHASDDTHIKHGMRLTHWGAGWLLDRFNRQALQQLNTRLEQSSLLFDLILAELGDTDLQQASLAVVNRLAQQFGCHQVQLGLSRKHSVEIVAVSHSAWFDEKAKRVTLAAQAMNEACDQRAPILWPLPDDGPPLITEGHRRYAEEAGSPILYTLPLTMGAKLPGVIMLERDQPFSDLELDFLDTLALAIAPVLELKREHEESLLAHARRAGSTWLSRLTDTSHPALKLFGTLAALLLILLAYWPTDYRVSAPSVVEGAVLRAIAAPFDGYIHDAYARAGDVVRQGQPLAKLEDQDLILEKVRWNAELQMARLKEREAMANTDRVNLTLATAQAHQASAQLDLTLERLRRVNLTAPFDGVVVKGDLSQKLGAPVQQGEVQFELAPLDAWRVILKVDERDIAYVHEGQPGHLVLTSLPGQSWPFQVSKVTPVAVVEEGRNYFRVEAALDAGAPKLRPNMEGVGKIEAGEKGLLWVWTHRLWEWLWLTGWKLLP